MSITQAQRKRINGFAKHFSAQEIANKAGVTKSAAAGAMAARTKDYNRRVTMAEATDQWAVTMAKSVFADAVLTPANLAGNSRSSMGPVAANRAASLISLQCEKTKGNRVLNSNAEMLLKWF